MEKRKTEKQKTARNTAHLPFFLSEPIKTSRSLLREIRTCSIFRSRLVSKNNTEPRVLEQFHKCSLINSHNTPKRYYYLCYCWGNLRGFLPPSVLHLYDFSSWDTSVLDFITVLCFQRISQLHSLINMVGVNGCIHRSLNVGKSLVFFFNDVECCFF